MFLQDVQKYVLIDRHLLINVLVDSGYNSTVVIILPLLIILKDNNFLVCPNFILLKLSVCNEGSSNSTLSVIPSPVTSTSTSYIL